MKNIITILAIIFTSTFYSQELGRIEFFDTLSNKTVVRKFNLRYMKFISPINKKDTTYIGVMADSVGLGTMKLSLYGYFPISIREINSLIYSVKL